MPPPPPLAPHAPLSKEQRPLKELSSGPTTLSRDTVPVQQAGSG